MQYFDFTIFFSFIASSSVFGGTSATSASPFANLSSGTPKTTTSSVFGGISTSQPSAFSKQSTPPTTGTASPFSSIASSAGDSTSITTKSKFKYSWKKMCLKNLI